MYQLRRIWQKTNNIDRSQLKDDANHDENSPYSIRLKTNYCILSQWVKIRNNEVTTTSIQRRQN